jgi:2',3'-cyclic-nucleotide 2'-phosphodiesterase/3'-nucleotidase
MLHRSFIFVLTLVLMGTASAATLKLRLLETTDLHMNLLNFDYYLDKSTDEFGAAKTATLIRAARAEVKNSLLFDNGDLIQGTPLGDQVATVQPFAAGSVHPAMKLLNALGYDAANIGNHEFNYGLPICSGCWPSPLPLRECQRSGQAARMTPSRSSRPTSSSTAASPTRPVTCTR